METFWKKPPIFSHSKTQTLDNKEARFGLLSQQLLLEIDEKAKAPSLLCYWFLLLETIT